MVQIRCLYCKKLVELPAKICPFCKKSLSGVAPVDEAYGGKSKDDDPLLPTTFEKKPSDGIPSWVWLLGAVALVWLVCFLAPVLLDATPREKKPGAKQNQSSAASPARVEVTASAPVMAAPTIRTNIEGAAALHNEELDRELMEESRLE